MNDIETVFEKLKTNILTFRNDDEELVLLIELLELLIKKK